MKKKGMSPETRQAMSNRMKERWANKRKEEEVGDKVEGSEVPTTVSESATPMSHNIAKPSPEPSTVEQPEAQEAATISVDDVQALIRRVQELELRQQTWDQPRTQGAPQVNQFGGLVGTFEKYVVDPNYYPDPRERLTKEPKLARFAFPINYEFDWEVTTTSYQTLDGVNTKEPRFNLNLIRIVMDEDTGLPTNGRYIVRKLIFHEDPQAALVIARESGLEVDPTNQREFLSEMQYLRMRDWLLDIFYPKPSNVKTKKREMVIGGKLVEYFEVNSEESETMPFNQLKNKL